jgi:alcohol dehydrogenase class IV
MLIASDRDKDIDDLAAGLPVAVRWREVRQHVPVENAERARAAAAGADVLVAVGGGSAIGLAKAVALTSALPILAVPTTYAGSEGTNVWGLTKDGVKTTGVDPAVLPVSVIYDSVLSASMPVDLSVASGLNALAHCVDALWAPRADPINTALALEGARALAVGLPAVVDEPASQAGRDDALYGTYLAAVAFASAGSALHHKICHVLGGTFDLPHAQTHAIVLPHVLALNAGAVPAAALRLAQALGSTATEAGPRAAVHAIEALRVRLHAPRALRDHGLAEADLDEAATRCLAAAPPTNPVAVTIDDLRTLIHAAWAGDAPVLRERTSR